jgi:hypothetical protein
MADDDDEIDELWSNSVSKAATPKKSPALVVDHKNYSAFEAKDKLLGYVVRCTSTRVHYQFFYHHLLTIALNSPDDDFFTLITSNAVIQVYGRNLQPIASAFGLHTCHSITEFSPEVFLPPSNDSQPYIEKIEVLLPQPPKKPERSVVGETQGPATRKRAEI